MNNFVIEGSLSHLQRDCRIEIILGNLSRQKVNDKLNCNLQKHREYRGKTLKKKKIEKKEFWSKCKVFDCSVLFALNFFFMSVINFLRENFFLF